LLADIEIIKINEWQSNVYVFGVLSFHLAVSHLFAATVCRIICSYGFTDVHLYLMCVRLKMSMQARRAAELLPTQDADVLLAEDRGLARRVVHAQVGVHVAAPVKQSHADRARERLNAAVHKPVRLETGGALKRFAANVAGERTVGRVDGHV